MFGGVIMSMVDRCAALSAMRHSGGQCTTLSIDRILFKEPIRVGELVEVRVARRARRPHLDVRDRRRRTPRTSPAGVRRHTNECWLTFVHLNEEGTPTPVPRLTLETADDRRMHDLAAQPA